MRLEDAQAMITAALEEARAMGIRVSAAVCDGAGHMVAFARMDGAEVASLTLAPDKAFTALANRMSTSELGRQAVPGGPLYGISANLGGRMVTFGGGCPIYDGERLIGGVGVSGGTPQEDETCCLAAIRARGYRESPT